MFAQRVDAVAFRAEIVGDDDRRPRASRVEAVGLDRPCTTAVSSAGAAVAIEAVVAVAARERVVAGAAF